MESGYKMGIFTVLITLALFTTLSSGQSGMSKPAACGVLCGGSGPSTPFRWGGGAGMGMGSRARCNTCEVCCCCTPGCWDDWCPVK